MCSCRLCNFQHFFDMAFAYTCKKLHSHMYCLTFLSAVQYDSCNRPRPHYAERIWKRKFHFETYQMFSVHTASEKFENGNLTLKHIKCFQSTLRQGNLKRESHSETHQMFSMHTASEEFENGNLTLKPIKCFQCTLRQRNLKKKQSAVILDLCLKKTPSKKWRNYRDLIVIEKLRFQYFRCSHEKKLKVGVFKFLQFEERYQKSPFSWRISVDGRPNCKNEAAFSKSSVVVWTGL